MAETVVSLSLSVSAPSSGTAGSAIPAASVSSVLSGGASPSGTITFEVFGPQASPPSDCSTGGTTVGTTTVSGNDTYSPPSGFTPSQAGDYWWYASYDGDSNNNPADSGCGAAMTETAVAAASPSVGSVSAPSTVTAGVAIPASAVSSALSGGASPSGTVTFEVFGPQSSPPSDCSTGGTTVGIADVSGNATYSLPSDIRLIQAGNYWWYASYGGDANNNPAHSACGVSMTETNVAADTSTPTISMLRPGQNAVYTRGQVVDASYSCADADGPGDVASCTGSLPQGSAISTQSVGVHSFTVQASDYAGNQASLTHSYTVYAANGSGRLTASPAKVSAASPHHTLKFTYSAAQGGIWRGELTLKVPAGWSPPSTNRGAPGYVTTSGGKASVSSRTIVVSIPILASRHTLTVTYGSRGAGGPGASAPSARGTQTWQAQEKSVAGGRLTSLAASPRIGVS
jgi:hypothetical protein